MGWPFFTIALSRIWKEPIMISFSSFERWRFQPAYVHGVIPIGALMNASSYAGLASLHTQQEILFGMKSAHCLIMH